MAIKDRTLAGTVLVALITVLIWSVVTNIEPDQELDSENGKKTPTTSEHQPYKAKVPSKNREAIARVETKPSGIVLHVCDQLTGKPVKNVAVSLTLRNASTVSSIEGEDGELKIQVQSIDEIDIEQTAVVTLSPDLGGGELESKLEIDEEGKLKVVAAVFARLIVTMESRDVSKTWKNGKLWLATWPELSAIATNLPPNQERNLLSIRRQRDFEAASTYKIEAQPSYHSELKKLKGVNDAKLQMVGEECVVGTDVEMYIPYSGEALLNCFVPGAILGEHSVRLLRGTTITKRIVVEPHFRIRGVVVDKSGNRVAKVQVSLASIGSIESDRVPTKASVARRPRGSKSIIVAYAAQAKSDDKGEFVVTLDFLHRISGYVQHPDYGTTEFKFGFEEVASRDFDANPLRVVLRDRIDTPKRIRILRNGLPIEDTNVVVLESDPIEPMLQVQYPALRTDSEGWADASMLVEGRRYFLINPPLKTNTKRGEWRFREGETLNLSDR